MLLGWMRIYEIAPKKMKAETLRQKPMTFAAALKEIHAALKNGYEIAFLKNDSITLLKYRKKEGDFFALAVNGSQQEIFDLQKDEIIKRSLL